MKYQPKPNYKSNDCVETPLSLCRELVKALQPYFKSTDVFLEPCAGEQKNFIKALNEIGISPDWCEIKEGKDFYNYKEGTVTDKPIDFILTNPPFSKLNARTKPMSFLEKAFRVSKNVCFLATLNHLLGLRARFDLMKKYNFGISDIILIDTPPDPWIPSGFQVGAVNYQYCFRGNPNWIDLRGKVNYKE